MPSNSPKRVKFSEIVQRVNETVMPKESNLHRYIGLEHLDSMDLTIRRWDENRNLVGQKLVVRKGDIIIARRNWYLRRVAIAPFDALCSAHAMIVRPNSNIINPDFLPFFLLSDQFFKKALSISAGSLSPTINWSKIKQLEFEIIGRETQNKTTEILQSLRSTIDSLENTITHVKSCYNKYITSQFKEMFNDDSEVSVKFLSEIVEDIHHGPFGSNLKSKHYSDFGPRVIRLQNIGVRKLLNEDKAFISDEYYKSDIMKKFQICKNDIILAGLGDDSNHIGRCFIADDSLLPAVQSSDAICIRISDSLMRVYVMNFLNSDYCFRMIKRVIQGSTRLRINGTNLKKLKIPIPDRNLMKKIIDTSNLFDELIPKLEEEISCLKRMITILVGDL